MVELFIAQKQILARKKQSIISIIGVMIGVTVLTVSLAISNGLDKNMIASILSMNSHVDVRGKLNQDSMEKIYNIEDVEAVIPTLDTQSILKHSGTYGDYISGVKVLGIDYKEALKSKEISDKIIDGAMLAEDKKKILIGRELAKNLDIKLGDKVHLISSQNLDLELEIGGIFQSGFYEYDTNLIIVPLFTAQYMDYAGDEISRLMLKLKSPYKADEVRNKIMELMPQNITNTWGEQNKALLSALNLEKTLMLLVMSLIVIIAAFLVWIILNTLVREKTKDIGIMRAMGFYRKNILKIFLIQGLFLGIIGIILGLVLSAILLYLLKNYGMNFLKDIYYLKTIPLEISMKEILIIVAGNVAVIFISSLLPAYRAAKMEDVEALRHD